MELKNRFQLFAELKEEESYNNELEGSDSERLLNHLKVSILEFVNECETHTTDETVCNMRDTRSDRREAQLFCRLQLIQAVKTRTV